MASREILLELPGAAFRWLLGKMFNSKRSFMSYFKEDSMVNFNVGLLIWFAAIIIYNVCFTDNL
jgi:hypothetical protein